MDHIHSNISQIQCNTKTELFSTISWQQFQYIIQDIFKLSVYKITNSLNTEATFYNSPSKQTLVCDKIRLSISVWQSDNLTLKLLVVWFLLYVYDIRCIFVYLVDLSFQRRKRNADIRRTKNIRQRAAMSSVKSASSMSSSSRVVKGFLKWQYVCGENKRGYFVLL